MVKLFSITYEIITHESAAQGEAAERGYAMPYGWHFKGEDMSNADLASVHMSLRDAKGMCGMLEDVGAWFVECDGHTDIRTGAETRYSLHPPRNITEASYARLKRVLNT